MLDRHRARQDVDRWEAATESAYKADQANLPADAGGGYRLHDSSVARNLQDLVDTLPIGEGKDFMMPLPA
jgi:hypothetical protein